MEEKIKIDLELTKEELKFLNEFIGNTDIFFARWSIEELGLSMNDEELDEALYSLYRQLNDVLTGGE